WTLNHSVNRTFCTWTQARNKSENNLETAVADGDHLEVQAQLNNGVDPNTCMAWEFPEDWGGKHKRVPVLMVAVRRKNIDMVTLFLQYNVNTEFRGDFQATSLIWASAHGLSIIVEKLLNHNADINAKSSRNGGTPIHYAAASGHIQIMKMLRSRGSPLDPMTNQGYTPLHSATWFGTTNAAQWLVAQGADLKAVTNTGESVIDIADSRGHKELKEWLRSCEVDLAAMLSQLRIPGSSAASELGQQHNKKVFILNYIDFKNDVRNKFGRNNKSRILPKRKRASIDSQNLRSTFGKLGYEVYLNESKTADQTNIILDDIQQDKSLDFLLLLVLSHGDNDDIFYTADGVPYSLESIQQRFTDKECPQLMGKAKIIITNYCRGAVVEERLPTPTYQQRECNQTIAAIGHIESPHHMITINASHEEFAASRDTELGTSFVYNMCEALREQVNQPIQDIFNAVFDKMKRNGGQTPKLKISAPFAKFIF
ncbi:unnamed protein product, partial [Meganyctiphanes norvegica]